MERPSSGSVIRSNLSFPFIRLPKPTFLPSQSLQAAALGASAGSSPVSPHSSQTGNPIQLWVGPHQQRWGKNSSPDSAGLPEHLEGRSSPSTPETPLGTGSPTPREGSQPLEMKIRPQKNKTRSLHYRKKGKESKNPEWS